ncbi:hypothetical protein LEP1GSC202_0149 [Leptospira yanagawae serovar Saopaulo str. Sao Paulo = ATCC 700523]|uniref:DUF4129 domain-containing protein n=1 Tax=Leptospira yanagawae serovar Saopaulo str. Sao Paulo = ATCC 700523 TaxID=1249483 RepID=A0A5E8H8H8_9LEPT|nr:hypothetical protein [Leptospira yanagawae]EOQ87027.1 hypothetical protein LEP1GSC202_0149 [Leptospira yanagawae serovar Saopaulo str. Sao Paulo = ATCC 700523]
MYKLILVYSLFCFALFASPKESITNDRIFVGDKVQYEISWDKNTVTDVILDSGELYEDESLPVLEILSVEKNETKLTATVIFFMAGEFYLPTVWKENGKEFKSKLKIVVSSNLTGQESDIEDLDPPLVFSGPYLFRLFGLIIFFCINLYVLYALYLYWKSKPKVVNAIWEKNPTLPESTKRLRSLEQYLQSDSIFEKELTFKISEYLKEVYSEKLNENLLGQTDSAFLSTIHDKTHIPDALIREIRMYFRELKYNQSDVILSKEKANEIWNKIKKDFLV